MEGENHPSEEPNMKPRVFATRNLPGGVLAALAEECDLDIWPDADPPPKKLIEERARGAVGLLTLLTDRIDERVLDAAGPTLRVVSNYAVGFDNIDVPAATTRGVPVGHTPGVLTETTADLAFALILGAARRLVEAAKVSKESDWRAWSPSLLLGWDVHGATLGVLGWGRIGQAVARRASGFEMEVIFSDPSVGVGETRDGAASVTPDELFARSDFLSLHVPLDESTRRLVDEARLSSMKRSAVLVNTARGPVVDHDALAEALAAGRIAYAALDVTDPEPLPPGHPLLELPNCLVVPHVGSASVATRTRMGEMAVANLRAGLRGDPLPNCVNPEVYDR
jgi:lactate dehydrogenase-like 2-hydroxyacid dehydrogenase